MPELVVFPDVEDVVRVHLAARFAAHDGFAGVKAHAAPKPRVLPAEFVFVQRTGGPSRDMVTDVAQITVESYAKSGSRCVAIASLVRAFLGAAERAGMMESTPVHEVVEFSGAYLDPDPNAPDHTRYSATFLVAVRGTVAS